MRKNSVIASIFSLSFLGLVAKVFGLVRESIFAAYFGTSAQMDLYGLLTGYVTTAVAFLAISLGAAYSPHYVRLLQQEGEKEASHRFSLLLNQYILFSIALFAIVQFFLPYFSDFVCSRLDGVERKDVILFSEIIFFTIITGGGTRLFVTALNGLRKYGWMQITQLLYAVIAIILTVLWGRRYGIIVVVLSFLINSVIQVALLWAVYFQGERKYSLHLELKDPDTMATWRALIPVFLGTETYMFGLSIDRSVGLSLGIVGSVAALNYAGVLFGMINTLITSPINTVFLVEMYRHYYKTGDKDVLFKNLAENWNHLAVALIPVAVFLCLSSSDFITIVLKRGAFNDQSVLITSSAFMMYALAAPFYAFRNLFTGVHLAMHDNKTPMWSGIIFLALNYLLANVFSKYMGVLGITLGSFTAMAISFFFQYFVIKSKHAFGGALLNKTFCKIMLSSIGAVVALLLFSSVVPVMNVYLRFVLKAGVFFSVFAVLLFMTRCEELTIIWEQLIKKN